MGKKSPSPPPAPDPVATAQAQGAVNREAAIANAELGMVDQYTPYGNLTYQQVGTTQEGTPRYRSDITLSPDQQRLLDYQIQGDLGTAQLGVDQLGRITDAVSSPFSFAGIPDYTVGEQATASQAAQDAIMSRLNPQFDRDEEALRSRLINQGIGQNSEAYAREFERFNQAKNDARTQAVLQGQQYGSRELADALTRRNQGIQEYTTQRNAPLNEYSALVSGTQVQNPNFSFGGGSSGTLQPVDYAGLVDNQYQANLGAYNAQVNSNNATRGGLFNLGATLGGSFLGNPGLFSLSDERMKEDIEYAGMRNGHKTYRFAYKDVPGHYFIGVIAQEVEKYLPEAVKELDGYKVVNYDMLGFDMEAA